MGLCKCPKKVVTTLFCYEHRVNVCESCLVGNHRSCMVQSYYKWLQDSEYDSKCPLCSEDLSLQPQETVRLTCFHVFHWKCFSIFFHDYPTTTAPDGYKCPTCSLTIFPSPNSASPVASELRKKLCTLGWYKVTDDLKMKGMNQKRGPIQNNLQLVEEARLPSFEPLLPMETKSARSKRTCLNFDTTFEQQRYSKHTCSPTLYTIEEDARKYHRRRPMTLRQNLSYLRRSPYCKFIFLILFTLFVLCFLFVTVIPTEFEDERAFNRIIELKHKADQSRLEVEVFDQQ